MAQLFGTDGVRGVANSELSPELAVGLGRALIRTLREQGTHRPRIAVGRDPRASGEMLEAALTAGICSAGGDVYHLGVVPTPGVAYLTPELDADSGAVISASHNPVGDNGIKFFGPRGYKLSDAEEERIEQLLQRTDEDRPIGTDIGRVHRAGEMVERYVTHLVNAADADLTGLQVVVDCANGAASAVAPHVYSSLGCEITAIHAEPDGTNINDHCGSTEPDDLVKKVVELGADVGIAHDGDADRLIAVDASGQIIDGDAILAVLAARMQSTKGLDTVVTTVMTNLGFTKAMAELGIEVLQTRVGDRYVLEAMRAGDHPLGGEQSGHLIMADHSTTGDGILSGVALLSAVADAGSSLADLAGVMERLPQVMMNVRGVDRDGLDGNQVIWDAVRQAEQELADTGRILVRASGTEPMVRVMVEADREARAQVMADRLAGIVARQLAL